MRPIRMSDRVRHHAGRVHERAPGAAPVAGTPCERRVLVGKPRVHAQRVLDLRMNQLSPLVERPELFAKAVNGIAGRKRERGAPQAALTQPAERWQPSEAAKV